VLTAACPSRQALALIAGKWALLVIPALDNGPLRNGELLRRIGGISQKVLSQTLKDLERNGLVIRADLASKPLHVEYRLSELGHSLSSALIVVDRWAETHHAALAEARRQFDDRLG